LGLGLAGAAIGFAIGGPFGAAAFGAQAGFIGGTLLGNILFPQILPDIVGSRLDPNKRMVAAYGTPIPIGFGQFVVGGIISYYPGFVEHEITEELGGKMGPTQTSRSYTYTGSFRANFCEGPADAILKIWMNRVLIYDATNTTEPIIDLARLERAPGVNAIRLYLGTETQLPDPTEQADKGVNATPAYRGIVGAFFQNYPLDDSGGLPPQITVLIAMKATEILPITTLTGAPGGNSEWEWQPGKQSFLTSEQTRISNANQQILKKGGFGGGEPQFPCVDGEGNFYRIRDGFGDPEQKGGRITKVSGETLNQLLESAQLRDPFTDAKILGSLNWSKARVFGGIRSPEGNLIGEMIYCQRDTLSATAETGVFAIDNLLERGGGCINFYSPLKHIDTIVVDGERFLWTAAENGADTELNRINPGSGQPIETYTITGETFDLMTYDPVTNSLILGNVTNGMVRWGLDSHVIDARDDSFTYAGGDKNDSVFWNGPNSDGTMYIQVGATLGGFQEYNVHSMSAEPRIWSPAGDWGLPSSAIHRGMMDESRNAMMKREDVSLEIHWLYFDRKTGDPITVKEIVDFICLRIGLKLPQFVTSNLTQQLHGYLIAQRVAANTAIDPLRRFFFFNPISEDFKIKFPLLGTASIATIPEDDLAAGDDGDVRVEVDKLVEEIISEIELPEVLEMESAGEKREYQAQIQVAKWPRTTTNSRRRRFLSFPGTFISDTDAAKRLETLLYQIWNKRLPVVIRTSQKWLKLSPADVITVQAEGLSHQMVIGQIDQGANNVLEIRGSADDPRDLVSVATGFSGEIPGQTISNTAASQFFILDISLLRDQDDGFGVYVGGGPFNNSTGWKGEEIFRSLDGMDYAPFAFIPGSRAVDHGFTTTIPADADPGVWDRDTSITITMSRGTLPSTTEALALDGAGLLLVGNELLCYVTSVDNGNSSFTVSTLLRGRGGTEGEIDNHIAEERVIVISADTLIRKAMDLSDQGDPFFYKGVTRGGSLSEALRKIRTVLGKSQWTWAPVHVNGSITANDWTVNWTWRNRINGRWRNLQGLAAPGTFDYEVDILSGPGGTVLATYTSTASANGSVVTGASHQFFYDDADQSVDFGSPQTTVTFKIYPISLGGVGRGFSIEQTLIGG
jgi:hypothetical protein